jgi:hypothetical protein
MKGNVQVSVSDFDSNPSISKWPFAGMAAGEVVGYDKIEDPDKAKRAQMYCHMYGRSCGKKFVTKSIMKDDRPVVIIRRVS